MKLRVLVVCLLSLPLLHAQPANLAGVWKANIEKSKGMPPQSNYLVIIEQADSKLTEHIATYGPRGEQRSLATYDLSGKETMGTLSGLPIKSKANWDGSSLVIDAKQPGVTIWEKYTLSSDGNSLTVESKTSNNGRDMARTLVLEKQPDSAGDALRKPEQTAAEHFKNIQILKDRPASSVIDTMRAFNMSLGVNCEFCHVQGNFPSDDKPKKAMARKMLTMTAAINQQNFNGKMEVRCYTCHQGHEEPQSRPAF